MILNIPQHRYEPTETMTGRVETSDGTAELTFLQQHSDIFYQNITRRFGAGYSYDDLLELLGRFTAPYKARLL